MNRAVLILSFIFLSNPAIQLLDPLPDFIGWSLLYFYINHIKYLSVQMELAATNIKKMIWLTLAGIASLFVIPTSDGTMILTVTFAVNVLKLVWGIPALKGFFNGISELGALYDSKSIYIPLFNKNEEGIKTVEGVSVLFLIVSAVLNTVPELAELTEQTSTIYSEGHRYLASYKPIFYGCAILFEIALMIIFLTVTISFATRMSKEQAFISKIKTAYDEKMVKTGKQSAIMLRIAVLLKAVSGVLIFCVITNNTNYIPIFLFPLVTLLCALIFAKNGHKSWILIATCLPVFALTLYSYILNIKFAQNYTIEDIAFNFEAYDLHALIDIMQIVSACALIILELIWLIVYRKVALKHSMREILSVDNEKYIEEKKYNEKLFVKNLLVVASLFVIACVASVVAYYLNVDFSATWLIALFIDIVWFVLSYANYKKTYDGIENRYL